MVVQLFRCVLASLYEGLSVRRLVGRSVGQSVGSDIGLIKKFFDASSHLYMRVCPSVGPSVGWSVGPSETRIFRISKNDAKWLKMIGNWSRKYESV